MSLYFIYSVIIILGVSIIMTLGMVLAYLTGKESGQKLQRNQLGFDRIKVSRHISGGGDVFSIPMQVQVNQGRIDLWLFPGTFIIDYASRDSADLTLKMELHKVYPSLNPIELVRIQTGAR